MHPQLVLAPVGRLRALLDRGLALGRGAAAAGELALGEGRSGGGEVLLWLGSLAHGADHRRRSEGTPATPALSCRSRTTRPSGDVDSRATNPSGSPPSRRSGAGVMRPPPQRSGKGREAWSAMASRRTSSSARACSARAAAIGRSPRPRAAPPFRFSRMGPQGVGHAARRREPEEDRGRDDLGAEHPRLGRPRRLHLPRPVRRPRPDLRPHRGHARRRTSRRRSCCRPARRALDLDSLYGAGPHDPGSAKFYEADGLHLKIGNDDRGAAATPALHGHDLPRGAGDDARSARRSSPTRATTRTSPSRRRTSRSSASTTASSTRCRPSVPAAQQFSTARELVTKHYQWMIRHDYLPRICARGGRRRRLHERPQGVRGRRGADRRADDADRVLGRRVPARAQHDPRAPTTGTRTSTTAPAAL